MAGRRRFRRLRVRAAPWHAAEDKPRRRVNRAACPAAVVVVLALVAAVGAFFVLDGPGYIASMAAEVDEAAVSSVLEANTTLMAGFASNDDVAQTPGMRFPMFA